MSSIGSTASGFNALLRGVDDPRTSRWRGPAIPWFPRPDGFFGDKGTREVIWASIVHILLTPIGTRVRKPEFGSRLYDLLFEPNDDILVALARIYIIEALRKWEPRIEIVEAEAYRDTQNEHALVCRLTYRIRSEGIEERRLLRFSSESVSMERVV